MRAGDKESIGEREREIFGRELRTCVEFMIRLESLQFGATMWWLVESPVVL